MIRSIDQLAPPWAGSIPMSPIMEHSQPMGILLVKRTCTTMTMENVIRSNLTQNHANQETLRYLSSTVGPAGHGMDHTSMDPFKFLETRLSCNWALRACFELDIG